MKAESEKKRLDPDIKRHIKIWFTATLIAYAVCVVLFLLRWEMEQTILSRPFFFMTEKIIASVTGISFLTGVIIYLEIVSGEIIIKKLMEAPIALAIYCGTMLYCLAWIWTYS